MTFRGQIAVTAIGGFGMFGGGILLWIGSQVISALNNGLIYGLAKFLFWAGLFLLFNAFSRSMCKLNQRKFERNGWTHPTATVGPLNRWYYWVDINGKDRDDVQE